MTGPWAAERPIGRGVSRISLFCSWIWVFALLTVSTASAAQTAAELEQQLKAEKAALDSLKTRLAQEETHLKQSREQQQTETGVLSQIERNIFQVKSELRTVQNLERDLARRQEGTEQRLRQTETRVQVREAGMAQRLREMYKLERRGTLSMLFSSASFSDAVKRVRYLARVAEQDRRDYRALLFERKRVRDLYALQRTQHEEQQAMLQSKLKKEQSLQRLAADKTQTIQQLKQSASRRQRAIQNLRAQEAQSADRVAELIKQYQEAQRRGQRLAELPPFKFAAHKGQLPRPVTGKVVTRFGRQQDPELKTWTFNRGINIAAPEGTDVRAIAPGEVVMVDWFPGYGRFVLLRHPEGFFSLYGHLASDAVRVGEILAEGTVLGTVGSTGRLDGVPQLHFEIMQGEDPLDPLLWLGKQ